ncbi:hypothetical protein [Cohnella terricola]|uniref:hypothetical protein n=1 Tax=Cohnella terricola TaxID=1289167 RepID=UPI001FECF913|nr:hypothetical protein [Cohnella terricola]
MKVSIERIGKEREEEILIRCHEVNGKIYEIVDKLKAEELILLGYQNDSIHRIKINDISAADSKRCSITGNAWSYRGSMCRCLKISLDCERRNVYYEAK